MSTGKWPLLFKWEATPFLTSTILTKINKTEWIVTSDLCIWGEFFAFSKSHSTAGPIEFSIIFFIWAALFHDLAHQQNPASVQMAYTREQEQTWGNVFECFQINHGSTSIWLVFKKNKYVFLNVVFSQIEKKRKIAR